MRYLSLSRKLLLYVAAVIVMCFMAGTAFAIDSVGSFDIVSESDAGSYSSLTGMVSGDWITNVGTSSIPVLQDSRDLIVLTIPTLVISASPSDSATKQFIAKVSYDFSVLSESVYADTENTLTFYPVYSSTSAGTAKFYNASMDELTAYDINTNRALTAGYIVMTLTSGDTYTPFVAVRSTSGLVINAVSTSFDLYNGGTQEVNLTVSNYTGSVEWEIISSSDSSSYYPVKSSIASSDSGHSAVLTFTVPAKADYQQAGVVEIAATDQTSGAQATITLLYNVEPKLTITLSSELVSVDIDDTLRVPFGISGSYGSLITYEANDDWITFDDYFLDSNVYAEKSADIILSPTGRFLQGGTWSVDITVSDSRASYDKRGLDVVTLRVHVYAPLSLDVSSSAFTISSGDVPEVTFTAHNAQGDLSFDVSASWASVENSKFVVVGSIDKSLQGTTQEVTVTARDDRGRDGDPRGESSVVLSITISKDAVPALELALSPTSLTVVYDGSGTATLTPSNAVGTVSYTSSASWATISENTITVNFDSAYAGTTQTATITATDSGRTSDNTATVELSVTFGNVPVPPDPDPFRLSISTATLSVSPGGSVTATLTPENVLGTVSYTSSASWVNISGNTITVNYDSAFAGTTQTATITATDSGRTSENTRTVQLSVTFGNIPDPDYNLVLNINTQTLNIRAGVDDSINLSLTGAESAEGVTWSYAYDSVAQGASSADNPLGLSFSEESATSAVLNVNPDRNAVAGSYTVHIYTSTTSGKSTGGEGVITINVSALSVEVLRITASQTSVSCKAGETFTIDFVASNAQGVVSWDIVEGEVPEDFSLDSTDDTHAALECTPVAAGSYSFTVRASDGANSDSVSITVEVSSGGSGGSTTKKTPRAETAPLIEIRPANLTPEVISALRATLGLTASEEIRSLTSDNILSPVSPDAETETAMNQLGYQLAASLSRIAVTEGGLYAFVFSIPSEYVGFSMNDLSILSKVLGSYRPVSSGFYASAVSANADGLTKGNLLGTDGMPLTNSVSEMLAVMNLEAYTESGTFFGSVVVPDEDRLPELSISTITQESFDALLPELEQVSRDTSLPIMRLADKNIGDPQEATEAVKQEAARNNFEIMYKLNSISVDVTGYYVFEINLPDEFKGLAPNEWKLMVANQARAQISAAADPFTYFEVLNILGDDSTVNKALAMVLAQAGQSASMYVLKILIAILLGGCETSAASYAGYGIIALAGVMILVGARMFRRR